MNQEGTLKPDEVYALTAAILYWNGIIQESAGTVAATLPKVKMPNREDTSRLPFPVEAWDAKAIQNHPSLRGRRTQSLECSVLQCIP